MCSVCSKTPIYHGIKRKGETCGKSGFCLLVLTDKSLKRGKDDDRGKSRFAVKRGAVNRGFTVHYINTSMKAVI